MSLFAGAGGNISPQEYAAHAPRVGLRRRSRLLHGAASFVAALGLAGAAALAFAGFRNAAPPSPAPAAAPKSAWVEYGKPIQIFALQTADFGKDVRLYEARRHREGGGRQDMLSYGPADISAAPSLRISLYRPGTEPAPESAFFVDMARQTARAGFALTRSSMPGALATRFGAFDVSDLVLEGGRGGTPCLGFRLSDAAAGLQISGFACGGAKPLERPALACALDRLDLIAAGDDADLAKFFIAAEQGRGKACAGTRGHGAKSTWLDQGALVPPLRAAGADPKTVSR